MVKMETKYTGALGLSTLHRKPLISAVRADWGAALAALISVISPLALARMPL